MVNYVFMRRNIVLHQSNEVVKLGTRYEIYVKVEKQKHVQ